MLQSFVTNQWDVSFSNAIQQQAIDCLEKGEILYFPKLTFSLSAQEKVFLSADLVDPYSKNISYHSKYDRLWGVQHLNDNEHLQLKAMLDRFSRYTNVLLQKLLPRYQPFLIMGRTSFRPVQISERKTSYRKDDKRLHVDAFPSSPNQGKRILRVFCNINPDGHDRVWRIGEPFEEVVHQFHTKIRKPLPGSAALLRLLKITKSYRTPYDHYMLQLHNLMKKDEKYQRKAKQETLKFPPGCTWILQTDQVSHAAMYGQHVLEQTFYLPVSAMQDESLSPLRVLERILHQPLINEKK